MHPDLSYNLMHETWRLNTVATPEEALDKIRDGDSRIEAGEKLAYINPDPMLRYMQKWREFWPGSLVIHIVRGLDAVLESNVRVFKKDRGVIKTQYQRSERAMAGADVYTIQYEALCAHPYEELRRLYANIGRSPADEHINKVLTTKEPWECDGRVMMGLKYRDQVG
jgi:hypothetical protein